MKQKFGAGIWHFATYVDRYATDGYGEPRSVLDAISLAGKVRDLSVVDINFPYFGGQFSHQKIKKALDKENLEVIGITPEIYTKEFIAVCPFSGLPDVAKIKIEYYPEGKLALELKSLKYYLISFKNVGIYQEEVTKRIYNDLKEVLKTKKIRITSKYNVRGGLYTTCVEGNL